MMSLLLFQRGHLITPIPLSYYIRVSKRRWWTLAVLCRRCTCKIAIRCLLCPTHHFSLPFPRKSPDLAIQSNLVLLSRHRNDAASASLVTPAYIAATSHTTSTLSSGPTTRVGVAFVRGIQPHLSPAVASSSSNSTANFSRSTPVVRDDLSISQTLWKSTSSSSSAAASQALRACISLNILACVAVCVSRYPLS